MSDTASGNDFSALIPDGPYGDVKKKKRYKQGKRAAKVVISLIGRRPVGTDNNK